MNFKRNKIGNQNHKANGQFASSSYIRAKNRKKWFMVFTILFTILSTLVLWLSDLTAQKVANALYPIPKVVEAQAEHSMTIKEHICVATDGENCDVLYNLCTKESHVFDKTKEPCQQYSTNYNSNGTYDHSWYQINDVHIIGRPASNGQGTITLDCVYDLYCASRWANEQIKKGNGHIWVAWSKI